MQGSSEGRSTGLPLILDLAERTALAVFFGGMAWTFLRSWQETGQLANPILLLSEGSIVAFALTRRFAREVSVRPLDWVLALLGTMAPLLVRPAGDGAFVSALVCAPVMLAGFALQIAAKFTLRRSFGVVAANRGVKIGGPYRLMRHPMYAGYIITQVAFLLINPSAWNAAVYAFAFAIQLGRILAEERVLGRDPAYQAFAAAVRYRLVPGVF